MLDGLWVIVEASTSVRLVVELAVSPLNAMQYITTEDALSLEHQMALGCAWILQPLLHRG